MWHTVHREPGVPLGRKGVFSHVLVAVLEVGEAIYVIKTSFVPALERSLAPGDQRQGLPHPPAAKNGVIE